MFRVLIVEDNLSFRKVFKMELHNLFPAAAIEEAGQEKEVWEKISGMPPQVIFMDIHLPGMNGFQLTQKIKEAFPDTRIAIVTAYDSPEYREAAIRYGADRFFCKNSLNWGEIETFVKSIPEGIC